MSKGIWGTLVLKTQGQHEKEIEAMRDRFEQRHKAEMAALQARFDRHMQDSHNSFVKTCVVSDLYARTLQAIVAGTSGPDKLARSHIRAMASGALKQGQEIADAGDQYGV